MIDINDLLLREEILVIVCQDNFDFCIWRDGRIRRCWYFDGWWLGVHGSYASRCFFFIRPFAVAVDSGRYFWTALALRPGHDKNWLLLMALSHMDGGGLKAHW